MNVPLRLSAGVLAAGMFSLVIAVGLKGERGNAYSWPSFGDSYQAGSNGREAFGAYGDVPGVPGGNSPASNQNAGKFSSGGNPPSSQTGAFGESGNTAPPNRSQANTNSDRPQLGSFFLANGIGASAPSDETTISSEATTGGAQIESSTNGNTGASNSASGASAGSVGGPGIAGQSGSATNGGGQNSASASDSGNGNSGSGGANSVGGPLSGAGGISDGDGAPQDAAEYDNSGDSSLGTTSQNGSSPIGGGLGGTDSVDSGGFGALGGNGGSSGTEYSGGVAETSSSVPTYSVPEPASLLSVFAGLALIRALCVRRKKFEIPRLRFLCLSSRLETSAPAL